MKESELKQTRNKGTHSLMLNVFNQSFNRNESTNNHKNGRENKSEPIKELQSTRILLSKDI